MSGPGRTLANIRTGDEVTAEVQTAEGATCVITGIVRDLHTDGWPGWYHLGDRLIAWSCFLMEDVVILRHRPAT